MGNSKFQKSLPGFAGGLAILLYVHLGLPLSYHVFATWHEPSSLVHVLEIPPARGSVPSAKARAQRAFLNNGKQDPVANKAMARGLARAGLSRLMRRCVGASVLH